MISVEEAVARIAGAFQATAPEALSIAEAAGRVLAQDAIARMPQPPAAVSSMDGYAVRAADTQASAVLRVIGSAPAGHPFGGKVGAGEAVRIFTGAVVPEGADAIVIQEDTEFSGGNVAIGKAATAGKHIRAQGLDFQTGNVLAKAGARLTARDLALLASADIASLNVRRKPVVAFAATGDELSPPGAPRKPGGIVASSGYGLSALIERWGGHARDLGILPDKVEALAALPQMASGADLIITLGGASVGDHDLVQRALGPRGFVLDFWKIAMRPGKPLIFGKLGATPFLGLPGNPVSTFVCALLFLRPAIAAMLGERFQAPFRSAKLVRDLPANDSRQDYLRATLEVRDGELWADPFVIQDSSMLSVLARADALVIRKPNAPAAPATTRVEVLPLEG